MMPCLKSNYSKGLRGNFLVVSLIISRFQYCWVNSMAVLIEGISVVIRCDSLTNSYSGGIKSFMSAISEESLCADGELACVKFLRSSDVRTYVEHLERCGLRKEKNSIAVDFVVVDQLTGLCSPCNWAEFGKTNWNDNPKCPISVCRAIPTRENDIVVPDGWHYESSLSKNYRYVDDKGIPDNLELIGTEKNLNVFYDKNTGQEFYSRR